MGIDSLLPDSIKLPVLGVIALLFVLSTAARKFPAVQWLQTFRVRDGLTEEQRARHRRTGDIFAGVEMVAMGLGIPLVYLLVTVAFFAEVTSGALLLVGACSLLLVGLGVWVIVRARSP